LRGSTPLGGASHTSALAENDAIHAPRVSSNASACRVSGDAVATAANLGAMESLWRIGIAAEILLLLCASALTVIFYLLLRPVSRALALWLLSRGVDPVKWVAWGGRG
jgi:hypothetical protein